MKCDQYNLFKPLYAIVVIAFLTLISLPVSVNADPPPRTLYYNAFDDSNWSNLQNWWDDAGFSVQAGSLPNSTDIVYISGPVLTNSGAPAVADTLYFDDVGNSFKIDISISVLNGATFYNNSYIGSLGSLTASDFAFYNSSSNRGTISNSSPPEFYDTSYNSGTIIGDANFNNSSYNTGNIDDVASQVSFYDSSHNSGSVDGDAYFSTTYYDSTKPTGGVFTVSLNPFLGIVSGITFGYEGTPINSYVFNGSYLGSVDITATTITFNNSSYNNGATIHGNAIFNGNSSENTLGTITGTKTRRYVSSITITRNFVITAPWTVVAEGSGVEVNVVGATYNGTTTFTEVSGGRFIYAVASGASASGGGAVSIQVYPSGIDSNTLGLKINGLEDPKITTNSAVLFLSFNANPNTVSGYVISLNPDFLDSKGINQYVPETTFTLPQTGEYVLYLKYYSSTGNTSQVISRQISYQTSNISLFTRNLHIGDKGEDVRSLQKFLNLHGFFLDTTGFGSQGNETTYYGVKTSNAVRLFQEKYKEEILFPIGIKTSTGLFYPQTRKKVNQMLGN